MNRTNVSSKSTEFYLFSIHIKRSLLRLFQGRVVSRFFYRKTPSASAVMASSFFSIFAIRSLLKCAVVSLRIQRRWLASVKKCDINVVIVPLTVKLLVWIVALCWYRIVKKLPIVSGIDYQAHPLNMCTVVDNNRWPCRKQIRSA